MATVKCAYGKRGIISHEWNDGQKDRLYCLGRFDLMTYELLDVCKRCRDCVIYAEEDFDAWNRRARE